MDTLDALCPLSWQLSSFLCPLVFAVAVCTRVGCRAGIEDKSRIVGDFGDGKDIEVYGQPNTMKEKFSYYKATA